ncbi:MAG: DUF5996 family protein [Coriobacteriia bacterium]
MVDKPNEWPALPYAEWAATKKTVQLYTQILGKTKLELAPLQPQWLAASLEVTARGLTTGAMPWGTMSVEVSLDFHDHTLRVALSDGRLAEVSLLDLPTVADVWSHVSDIYAEFGITVDMWAKPQEVEDTTCMSSDTRPAEYDPVAVARWWTVTSAVRGVFDEWRSPFFGRTHVPFWWGAFDLAVLRFTGKKAVPPEDRGYIMRYDLDAEFMNAGFWPGDDSAPDPILYAYIYPKPEACELAPINPKGAAWIEQMGEWVMPYETALETRDPRKAIPEFLDAVYSIAGEYGGWDLSSYTYEEPSEPVRDQCEPAGE